MFRFIFYKKYIGMRIIVVTIDIVLYCTQLVIQLLHCKVNFQKYQYWLSDQTHPKLFLRVMFVAHNLLILVAFTLE